MSAQLPNLGLSIQITAPVIVAGFTFWYLRKPSKTEVSQVDYEQATASLEKLREWSVWITGLSTASIGGIGYVLKESATAYHKLTLPQYIFGFIAVLFFGYAVFLSTWLFGAVPSLFQRLKKTTTQNDHNDIYEMSIFANVRYRTVQLCSLQHIYFMIGFVSLSVFILLHFELR